MGIADLFRPKHRHSDAAVRAEAVSHMGIDQAELIADIARSDRDAQVRRVAVEKLDDPEVLAAIAGTEDDREVARTARRRAADLWILRVLGAAGDKARAALDGLIRLGDQRALAELAQRTDDAGIRDRALEQVDDPRALAELARTAPQPEVRTTAVGRIRSVEVLRSIAMDDERKDVALSALDRIDDRAVLSELASKAKSKAVRSRARRRVQELGKGEVDAAEMEAKRVHAERVQLIRIVEELSTGHEWIESLERIDRAEAGWRELGAPEDASLQARFESATERYHRRRERYGAHSAEVIEKTRAIAEAAETEKAAAREQARAAEKAAAEKAASERPAAEVPAAEPTAETPAAEAPAAAPSKAEAEAETSRQAERARLAADNLAQLVKLADELDALRTSTSIRDVDRGLKRAGRARSQLNPLPDSAHRKEVEQRVEDARQALVIRARELREADEWKRWSAASKQEQLIRKAEALLASEDDARLGERLKELQAEWRSLGGGPRDRGQELWERFKSTCDQVYERVRAQRGKLDEERKGNLTRKLELCEQAEAIQDSTDWEATANELKRLQAAWKEIGPVPRRDSKKVWERFRAACDHFFERRQPHLEESIAEQTENLERKRALIERAEVLAESSDWAETAGELKRLQAEWKGVGPVPRKDATEVNQRFRAACDRFFERRKAEAEAAREARRAAVHQLGADIDGLLDAGWDAPEPAEMASRTLELRARYRALAEELGAAEVEPVRERLERLTAQVVSDHPAEFAGTDLDPEASRTKKEKLVERAEALAPAEDAEAAAASAEEMAEKLRSALARNALGLNALTGGRPVTEIIAELRESWRRAGPVPGAEGAALDERFERACARAAGREADPTAAT
jgi:hypothetical protein